MYICTCNSQVNFLTNKILSFLTSVFMLQLFLIDYLENNIINTVEKKQLPTDTCMYYKLYYITVILENIEQSTIY